MVSIRRSMVLVTLLALIGIPGSAVAQSPGADGGGGSDPALEAVTLMNKVPVGVMETCVPSMPSLAGQLALAECQLDGDTVLYASFEDEASLDAAWEVTSGVSVEGGATSCADGPFKGTYRTVDGVEAGLVVCQVGDPGLLLAWTDVSNLVLGVLGLADEQDYGVLHERWLRVRLDARAALVSPSATRAPGGFGAAPARSPDEVAQWAVGAVASSQYGSDEWSASQATGEPDTSSYGDFATAWAPSASEGGDEWIELTFQHSVVPTRVDIHESSGAGSVIRVEAWDEDAGTWDVLWEGTDPSPDELTVFSPPLDAGPATDRIRITIDTAVPGWNEIDAVALVGTQP